MVHYNVIHCGGDIVSDVQVRRHCFAGRFALYTVSGAHEYGGDGLRFEGCGDIARIVAERRLMAAWNIGVTPALRRLVLSGYRSRRRDIDVYCRLGLGPPEKREWLSDHRRHALSMIEPLDRDFNILATGDFQGSGAAVSYRQYLKEMRRSRIAVSPFGWGEICPRDFEAVGCGCLLIKPNLAHLDTHPNLFIDGETYVALKWDLSDLEEKCRYYLAHPDEITRITQTARDAYRRYFQQDHWLDQMRKIFNRFRAPSSLL